jgi:hypothetical protein
MDARVLWLTDDLDVGQFQALLQWLNATKNSATPAAIKRWRRINGLPVDKAD